jgi:predicted glycosyltransferase/peptidoglycan/xylan/chitin deacetylase (PgdA/CDA1 family)
MSSSVLIAVTHLLGVGHLSRAAALARGLAAAGHRVTLVSGGRPAPLVRTDGVTFVQLPPVHCVGTDFRTVLGTDGAPARPDLFAERIDGLLGALRAAQPEIVVTETFPFGRRQLAAEFTALLEAASAQQPRPTILASIRDILNPPSRREKAEAADAILARFYDGVLVHGEETFAPLAASWPVSAGLQARLFYTGYLADAASPPPALAIAQATGEILVSGGGSAASLPLFEAAIAAAQHLPSQPWRILVGHGVAAERFAALAQAAPSHVIVERARPDFPALLAGAAMSVSQAGYNTMIDLARAGVPAVVVPFEEGSEAEQRLRAERFAAAGKVTMLPAADCTGETLAVAVSAALAGQRPFPGYLATGGVAQSALILDERKRAVRFEQGLWEQLGALLDRDAPPIHLWWRDDDAVGPGPALDRLLALTRRYEVPLSLAVIPAGAERALADRLAHEPDVSVLVHGYAHRDFAAAGEKKQEFGLRPLATMRDEAADGLDRLRTLFGERALPVFVPPWNRIDPALVPLLPEAGYRGLSTYGAAFQDEGAAAGLAVVNTHIDPIDWHGSRSALPAIAVLRALLTLLENAADPAPSHRLIGLLTHHLVHDAWVWQFVDHLLRNLLSSKRVRFVGAERAFALHTPVATKVEL